MDVFLSHTDLNDFKDCYAVRYALCQLPVFCVLPILHLIPCLLGMVLVIGEADIILIFQICVRKKSIRVKEEN